MVMVCYFVYQCLCTRILFSIFAYIYTSEVKLLFLFFIMSLPSFVSFWPHGMNWGILSFFTLLWKGFQKLDS